MKKFTMLLIMSFTAAGISSAETREVRGQVLTMHGNRLNVRDNQTGRMVSVRTLNPVNLKDIRPGDQIRVNYTENGATAYKIFKETP